MGARTLQNTSLRLHSKRGFSPRYRTCRVLRVRVRGCIFSPRARPRLPTSWLISGMISSRRIREKCRASALTGIALQRLDAEMKPGFVPAIGVMSDSSECHAKSRRRGGPLEAELEQRGAGLHEVRLAERYRYSTLVQHFPCQRYREPMRGCLSRPHHEHWFAGGGRRPKTLTECGYMVRMGWWKWKTMEWENWQTMGLYK